MNSRHHTDDLGTMPIGRLLLRIAVPASVAFFVTSTYNLVDAIFVGRGVGPEAIGALTLIMPFQMFITAFGTLLAIGSASIVSRGFGSKEISRVKTAAGTGLFIAAAFGVFVVCSGQLFLKPLLNLLGATGDLVAPVRAYFSIILFVEPLLLLNVTGESLIRAEGQAKVAMASMVAGMLLNIALDPLFIFVFGWGIAGAAFATIIARLLTFALIVRFLASKRSSVGLRLKNLKPNRRILREIAAIGSSGFMRQVSDSVVYALGNNLLVAFGNNMLVTAYGAVFRAVVFLGMPALGVAQALPPIAGYNYGAGSVDRVRKVVRFSLVASTSLMLIGFTLFEAVPQIFLRLFSDDPQMISSGVSIMRIKAPVMLVYPSYMIGSSFYQALGKPGRALFLSMTRPIFSLILMTSTIRVFGTVSVVAAEPIAVAVGAVLALIFLRRDMKKLRLGAL